MSSSSKIIQSEKVRAYIYRVEAALVPVLVFYGIASEREAALWAGLLTAVTGLVLAAANTSTADPEVQDIEGS